MSGLTPAIGTSGTFILQAPFDAKLLANTNYTCRSVRSFSEIAADGVDAYAVYYAPYNIDRTQYATDVNNGVCIVSLCSDTSNWVRVPSSYIVAFPNASGRTYTGAGLVVDLGVISDEIDLTYLKSRIIQSCADTIGVIATVKSIVTTRTFVVGETDHASIEAVRAARISTSGTEYSQIVDLQRKNTALQEQINALVAHYGTP